MVCKIALWGWVAQHYRFLYGYYSPLWGCAGDWGRGLSTCIVSYFKGSIFNMAANSSPKTMHFDNHLPWSPAQPQRGELWGCWGNWIKFRPQSNPTVQFDTTQKQSIWSYSQRVPRAWTCLIRLANFQDCQSCSSRIRAFYRWATLTM